MIKTASLLLFLAVFVAPLVTITSLACESVSNWIKRSVERWMPWLRK
ncbi:hypothetical protein EDC32_10855 [Laceyella sacchari]|jgi:hypothetical protein|nr:hypothetical protein EDC32_10855 [Laceyella sacchari]